MYVKGGIIINGTIVFVLAALKITLLDIVLSGDNIGVIALAIRNLNPRQVRAASMIGVSGAIGLRIFFASIITIIMEIEHFPIKLLGGVLLLKITWGLINQKEDINAGNSTENDFCSFWKAVGRVIIADVSMSLDNVLAIGGAANGNVNLIAFGVLLNIPILFFASSYVAVLMKNYRIIVYIGGAVLMYTASSMILQDGLALKHINSIVVTVVPWLVAVFMLIYGIIREKGFKT